MVRSWVPLLRVGFEVLAEDWEGVSERGRGGRGGDARGGV